MKLLLGTILILLIHGGVERAISMTINDVDQMVKI